MLDIGLIGGRIRELRRERGLTQTEFADMLYVSFQAVSNWERGVAPPELENIIRIAEIFGVTVDSLLRQSEEELFLGIGGLSLLRRRGADEQIIAPIFAGDHFAPDAIANG